MNRNLLKRITSVLVSGALTVSMIPSVLGSNPVLAATAETPYDKYGDIQIKTVDGKEQICTEDGTPVQLKGMSTFGLQWDQGYWVLNDDAFDVLANDWECDIIRLAMYVSEGGYHDHPAALLERVETGIELATERGMYVLVDWHILNGDTKNPGSAYCLEAGIDLPQYASIKAEHPEYTGPQLFFAYLSDKYGDQGNVLFETANEPNGNGGESNAAEVWSDVLLPYHQSVVDAIREYDADETPNIVICGTDNWSQFVNAPIGNPVVDPAVEDGESAQIAYTFHFYSGTHDTGDSTWLKDKITDAMENGLAVFCTEWGTSESSGDGGPYIDYSIAWINFMEENNISWCSWSLAIKDEISAAMQSTASHHPQGSWDPETELSITGNFVRAMIRGDEVPMIGSQEIVIDFDTLNVNSGKAINDKDQPYPGVTVEKTEIAAGNNALLIPADDTGVWGGPRIQFADLGTVYSIYTGMIFSLYSAEPQAFSIQPIIQTDATGWWNQQGEINITEADWTLDEATGLYKTNVDNKLIGAPEGDTLGHITLMFGQHDDLYIDDIGFSSLYNGDISRAPMIPDNPGEYQGMPFDFEVGGRQSWKPDDKSQINYLDITTTEITDGNHAMVFPIVCVPGANEWEDGVRLSSQQGLGLTYEQCVGFNAFTMDLYLEADHATTGAMALTVNSIPAGDDFWYTSGSYDIDFSAGEPVPGTNLIHYTVLVPLNNQGYDAGYPHSEGTVIRNIILALHNEDSDYSGNVYYDNITYINTHDGEPTPTPSETPADPTVTPTPVSDISGFISRLYTTAFERTPDEAGLEYWVGQVENEGVTGADLVRTFLGSDEFLSRELTNEEFVNTMFNTIFDRVPGDEEVNYWADCLENGADKNDIINGFINSPEFVLLCQSYGMDSGVSFEPVLDFVKRIYVTGLGRDYDPEGLAYWTTVLLSGNVTGSEVAHEYFFSDEFADQNVSEEEFINRLYLTFMDREGEEAGIAYWVEAIENGATYEEAFAGFVTSPEWINICNECGINP